MNKGRGLAPLPDFSDEAELYDSHLVPYVLYLPDDQDKTRAGLLGALWDAARWFFWERDPEKRGRLMGQYIKWLLVNYHWQGVVAVLRETNCVLEQSLDNGKTWAPVVDLNACIADAVGDAVKDAFGPMLEDQAETLFNQLKDLYDAGGIAGALPVLVYGDSDDAFRDHALCNAWVMFISFLCQAEIARRQGQALTAYMASDLVDTIGKSVGFLGPKGKAVKVATTWMSRAFRFGAALWSGISDVVLSDVAAQREVACCAYIATAGATISSSRFRDALDDCEFFPLSNAAQIAGAIGGYLDDLRMLLTFAALAAEFMEYAELGIFDDCFCGQVCTFEYQLEAATPGDVELRPDPFYPLTVTSGNVGSFVVDTGFVHGDCSRSDGSVHRMIALQVDVEALDMTRILSVEFDYDYEGGVFGSPSQAALSIGYGAEGVEAGGLQSVPRSEMTDGPGTFQWSGVQHGPGRVLLLCRSSSRSSGQTLSGAAKITRVKIVGICEA